MRQVFSSYNQTPKPTVEVAPKVLKEIGPPVVDYNGLAELYYGDLKLPLDVQPVINLKPLRGNIYGVHMPLQKSISIDPIKTTKFGTRRPLTDVLIHESQHLVDSVEHPAKAVLFSAARLSVLGLSSFLTYKAMKEGPLPDVGEKIRDAIGWQNAGGDFWAGYIDMYVIGLGIGGKLARKAYYKRFDPSELSARRTERRTDLRTKYAKVIQFPGRSVIDHLYFQS